MGTTIEDGFGFGFLTPAGWETVSDQSAQCEGAARERSGTIGNYLDCMHGLYGLKPISGPIDGRLAALPEG